MPRTTARSSYGTGWLPPRWLKGLLLIGAALGFAGPSDARMPNSGTEILNRAEATYVPYGHVHAERTYSNTVRVRVAPVESLLLTPDWTVNRAPGANVVLAHVLTNTGNVASSYRFTLNSLGETEFDLQQLRLVLDLNGNGVADAGEPTLLPDDTTLDLLPGASASLLVVGRVPVTSDRGNCVIELAVISTADSPVGALVTDIIRIGNLAAVVLEKQADFSGPLVPGAELAYRLIATNTGDSPAYPSEREPTAGTTIRIDGAPAEVFMIRDAVPAGTRYIPGSLSTQIPAAVALYRLPGDAPWHYRTDGDDAAAIEVAVAARDFELAPSVTTQMQFTVTLSDDATGEIVNHGTLVHNDGSGPSEVRSNEVRHPVARQGIGLAKRATPAHYESDPKTLAATGIARFRLVFVLENSGASVLRDAQISDVLEGAQRLGLYSAASRPSVGEYTVIAGSGKVTTLRGQPVAEFETAYAGTADHSHLLAPGAILPPGSAVEASFEVRVHVGTIDGFVYNTATATAQPEPAGSPEVRDDSVDGDRPDANGDGEPGNDRSPTPILLSLPAISILKTASEPRPVSGSADTFEIDYRIRVTNAGSTVAPYVGVSDNLNCTFRSFQNPRPVRNWEIVAGPVARNGALRINPGFTGDVPCAESRAAQTDPYAAIPREQDAQLTDRERHLDPGATESITFTVRVQLDPQVGLDARAFTNVAYAVTSGSGDRSGAQVVVSAQSSGVVTTIDPSGVVYNSSTRTPVAGVEVQLSRVACTDGKVGPITPADLSPVAKPSYRHLADGSVAMTTDSDGRYAFHLAATSTTPHCNYQLEVIPAAGSQLNWPSEVIPPAPGVAPGGAVQPQNTAPSGTDATTYFLQLSLGPDQPEVSNNHLPVDPVPENALILDKKGSRRIAEIGNTLEYTLRLKNLSGTDLVDASIEDRLPAGFRYVAGSTRLEGRPTADPEGSPGPVLRFALPGSLGDGDERTLIYRAQAGIGTPVGEAVNRAVAVGGSLQSNEARWTVRIEGGVFSDEAFIVGKVFLDQNGDGVQDPGELGVPGVRLLLEDGTGAVTDVEGKYSIYGLRPITHVLKLDTTTLPAGARLGLVDRRNAGNPGSRFVDLRNGELHKANFAIANCCDEPGVREEVERRRKALALNPQAEGEATSQVELELRDPRAPTTAELRARDASGQVLIGAQGQRTGVGVFESLAPRTEEDLSASFSPAAVAALPRVALESLIKDLDNSAAFIDLKEGDTLPIALADVRVKGRLGSTLRLLVNGELVPEKRVGKRSRLTSRQLEAWEYIGVELQPGRNGLVLEEVDPFGTVRHRAELTLVAPGAPGRIELEAPRVAVADARTPVRVRVRLVDDLGTPVTVRTQLTLEVDHGRWEIEDLNPDEPGTQVFLEGGSAEFAIIPPGEPEDARVRVSAGVLSGSLDLAYLPELRPLVGVGILEGVIDFRSKGSLRVGGRNRDAFEQSLRELSRAGDAGVSGRAAFFFKGTIKGEYLLTLAHDSDKDTRGRLFRDIQPDQYYPIYGDSSSRLFDAQSSGRSYLRIDRNRSWLLYGDFTTDGDDEVRQLSRFNRAANGAKYHYESDRVSGNVFASRDNLQQVVEEFPANGTSGPYLLANGAGLVENSERVEILVRDRYQPDLVLESLPVSRFSDYMIEPLTGRLRFAAPVASVDENLNPRSIRVSYEVDRGGPEFWTHGADARVRLGERMQLGVSHARDEDPSNPSSLSGVTAVVKLSEKSVITAEAARSDSVSSGTGSAARAEWMYADNGLKLQSQIGTSDASFDNASAVFGAGRTEATVDGSYAVSKSTRAKGEVRYSEDKASGALRRGALLSMATQISKRVSAEVGIRAADETEGTSNAAPGTAPSRGGDLLSVRTRVDVELPSVDGADVYVEHEQDVRDSGKRTTAVGGGYLLGERTRLYGRYELASSLTGPYGLAGGTAEDNAGVLGVETAYLQDGRLFSEFRLRDAIDGRQAQAASGVRQSWTVREGLRLAGSVETTSALGGKRGNDATAVTGSAEYTADARYRAYGSLELRFADAGNSYLNTLGVAVKIDKDWSLLGRSAISLQENAADDSSLLLSRQQLGLAWRQVDNDRWNALGRYELKREELRGGEAPRFEEAHILSVNVNHQPRSGVIATGRYATKVGRDVVAGSEDRFHAQLIAGRLTVDLPRDFDTSLQFATRWQESAGTLTSLGAEVGYQLLPDLWLSVGYNLTGFGDEDLAGGEYTDRGAYLRLRFKFDESRFQ